LNPTVGCIEKVLNYKERPNQGSELEIVHNEYIHQRRLDSCTGRPGVTVHKGSVELADDEPSDCLRSLLKEDLNHTPDFLGAD